jgi:hypothetical protein
MCTRERKSVIEKEVRSRVLRMRELRGWGERDRRLKRDGKRESV